MHECCPKGQDSKKKIVLDVKNLKTTSIELIRNTNQFFLEENEF